MSQLVPESDVEEVYDKNTDSWITKGGPKKPNIQVHTEIEYGEITKPEIKNPNFTKLWESRLSTLKSVETLLDFDSSLLDSLSKISNSIFPVGKGEKKKIVISSDLLSHISKNIEVDIHKYINNSEFKEKALEALKLSGNYGFFIERTDIDVFTDNDDEFNQSEIFPDSDTRNIKFNLVLLPMNLDINKGETTYKNAGISTYYLEYICNNLLHLEIKEKRFDFVREVSSKIDLSKLSNVELSEYFSSGNYLNFIFEKLIKEIFILSNGYIDKEISIGIAGYILRGNFDMEFTNLKDFFNIISKIVKIPSGNNEIIEIDLEDLKKIIESKNISIQKYILNPLFKQKIRETLKLPNNYGLTIDEDKSRILMIPIDDGVKRYSGIEKSNVEFIISNILKLDTKDKRTLFLNNIVSSIDLSKFSEEDLNARFSSGNYIGFIFNELIKYIFNYAKGNLDLDMAKSVAGALFREDFNFVNSNIASNFKESFSSQLALKLTRAYRIDDELGQKFRTSVDSLEDLLNKNLGVLPNDIEVNNFRKSFSNDIFTNFSENIKNSFKLVGITNIDENIIRGLFIYVVHNGDIKNPMKNFVDLIFSKIHTKHKELSKLFAFFNSQVVRIGNERYNYANLEFRDIEFNDGEYSVEKIFNIIREKLDRYHDLGPKIASVGRDYNELNRFLELTNKSIDKTKEYISEQEKSLLDLNSGLEVLRKNIPTGVIAILKKKKHLGEISKLEQAKIELENSLSKKNNNLTKFIDEKQLYLSRISADTSRAEVMQLEQEKKLLEEQIERIKEDFSNNLFYGLRQDKK
ncbi:MAG: hypothetical protein PHG82_04135 [Candidatus Gracilibacteria bacterium]|nr:hypothetical protein [Candidatus Gracilibacteria bacterium]